MSKPRQLEPFPNLVTMFLTRAKRSATRRSVAKREVRRRTSWREAARKRRIDESSADRTRTREGVLVSEIVRMADRELGLMAAGCVTVPTYNHQTTRDNTMCLAIRAPAVIRVNRSCQGVVPAVRSIQNAPLDTERADRTGSRPRRSEYSRRPDLVAGDRDKAALERSLAAVGRGRTWLHHYTSGTAARRAAQSSTARSRPTRRMVDVDLNDFGWGRRGFLSFLPASHAYENSGGQHFP